MGVIVPYVVIVVAAQSENWSERHGYGCALNQRRGCGRRRFGLGRVGLLLTLHQPLHRPVAVLTLKLRDLLG